MPPASPVALLHESALQAAKGLLQVIIHGESSLGEVIQRADGAPVIIPTSIASHLHFILHTIWEEVGRVEFAAKLGATAHSAAERIHRMTMSTLAAEHTPGQIQTGPTVAVHGRISAEMGAGVRGRAHPLRREMVKRAYHHRGVQLNPASSCSRSTLPCLSGWHAARRLRWRSGGRAAGS